MLAFLDGVQGKRVKERYFLGGYYICPVLCCDKNGGFFFGFWGIFFSRCLIFSHLQLFSLLSQRAGRGADCYSRQRVDRITN